MPLPHHTPDDPNVQRVELKLSDEQYLTVMVRPDADHVQQVDVSLFQQTPHVEGVEQDVLEILACVQVYGDGTVDVVVDKNLNEWLATDTEEDN
jgi:hypothetical protein